MGDLAGTIANILNPTTGTFSGNNAGSDAARSTIEAARIAAEASRAATEAAAAAAIRASEIAAGGMTDAANIAAEEARRSQEEAIRYQQEAVAKATQILDSSLGQTSATIVKTQQDALAILDQYGEKSADLYRPYVEYGLKAAGEMQTMADKGVQLPGSTTTTKQTGLGFDEWAKANNIVVNDELYSTGGSRRFNEQTGEYETVGVPSGVMSTAEAQQEYNKYLAQLPTTTQTGYDITKSAYYPLYQFQQEQQQKALDASLAARGLYNSGSGLEQQLKADTGLTQSFTADEYARAVDDFNRKLGIEGSLLQTGYGATGNLANIYQALGANKSGVVQWGGGALSNLQNQTAQSKANAAIGQGNSSSAVAMQTGNQLANIATGLGTGLVNSATNTGNQLANTYNNQGNALANIYMNQGNSLASIYNQAATNRNNLYAGLLNTGLYAYMRKPTTPQTTQPQTYNYGYNTAAGGGDYWYSDDAAASGYDYGGW